MFFLTRLGSVGNVANGATGVLSGYWSQAPTVAVGFNNIGTYNPTYKATSLSVVASLSSSTYNANGTCSIVPTAKTIVTGGIVIYTPNYYLGYRAYNLRYTGDSHTYTMPSIDQISVNKITTSIRFKGYVGGSYERDGTHHTKTTITIHYTALSGGAVSGSVVIYDQIAPFSWSAINSLTASQSVPTGDYRVWVTFKYTLTRDISYTGSGILEASLYQDEIKFELGTAITTYTGSLQAIGIGR